MYTLKVFNKKSLCLHTYNIFITMPSFIPGSLGIGHSLSDELGSKSKCLNTTNKKQNTLSNKQYPVILWLNSSFTLTDNSNTNTTSHDINVSMPKVHNTHDLNHLLGGY